MLLPATGRSGERQSHPVNLRISNRELGQRNPIMRLLLIPAIVFWIPATISAQVAEQLAKDATAGAVKTLVDQLRKQPAEPSSAAGRVGLYLIDANGGEATLSPASRIPGSTSAARRPGRRRQANPLRRHARESPTSACRGSRLSSWPTATFTSRTWGRGIARTSLRRATAWSSSSTPARCRARSRRLAHERRRHRIGGSSADTAGLAGRPTATSSWSSVSPIPAR